MMREIETNDREDNRPSFKRGIISECSNQYVSFVKRLCTRLSDTLFTSAERRVVPYLTNDHIEQQHNLTTSSNFIYEQRSNGNRSNECQREWENQVIRAVAPCIQSLYPTVPIERINGNLKSRPRLSLRRRPRIATKTRHNFCMSEIQQNFSQFSLSIANLIPSYSIVQFDDNQDGLTLKMKSLDLGNSSSFTNNSIRSSHDAYVPMTYNENDLILNMEFLNLGVSTLITNGSTLRALAIENNKNMRNPSGGNGDVVTMFASKSNRDALISKLDAFNLRNPPSEAYSTEVSYVNDCGLENQLSRMVIDEDISQVLCLKSYK